jgi:hypothetical protein
LYDRKQEAFSSAKRVRAGRDYQAQQGRQDAVRHAWDDSHNSCG